ncbi:unnamed protein product [Amoebophrya sp. A120]|nr:unnamed protein product [Amoebophrya sp. A120]|eukprot:GSA120T00022653001.1
MTSSAESSASSAKRSASSASGSSKARGKKRGPSSGTSTSKKQASGAVSSAASSNSAVAALTRANQSRIASLRARINGIFSSKEATSGGRDVEQPTPVVSYLSPTPTQAQDGATDDNTRHQQIPPINRCDAMGYFPLRARGPRAHLLAQDALADHGPKDRDQQNNPMVVIKKPAVFHSWSSASNQNAANAQNTWNAKWAFRSPLVVFWVTIVVWVSLFITRMFMGPPVAAAPEGQHPAAAGIVPPFAPATIPTSTVNDPKAAAKVAPPLVVPASHLSMPFFYFTGFPVLLLMALFAVRQVIGALAAYWNINGTCDIDWADRFAKKVTFLQNLFAARQGQEGQVQSLELPKHFLLLPLPDNLMLQNSELNEHHHLQMWIDQVAAYQAIRGAADADSTSPGPTFCEQHVVLFLLKCSAKNAADGTNGGDSSTAEMMSNSYGTASTSEVAARREQQMQQKQQLLTKLVAKNKHKFLDLRVIDAPAHLPQAESLTASKYSWGVLSVQEWLRVQEQHDQQSGTSTTTNDERAAKNKNQFVSDGNAWITCCDAHAFLHHNYLPKLSLDILDLQNRKTHREHPSAMHTIFQPPVLHLRSYEKLNFGFVRAGAMYRTLQQCANLWWNEGASSSTLASAVDKRCFSLNLDLLVNNHFVDGISSDSQNVGAVVAAKAVLSERWMDLIEKQIKLDEEHLEQLEKEQMEDEDLRSPEEQQRLVEQACAIRKAVAAQREVQQKRQMLQLQRIAAEKFARNQKLMRTPLLQRAPDGRMENCVMLEEEMVENEYIFKEVERLISAETPQRNAEVAGSNTWLSGGRKRANRWKQWWKKSFRPPSQKQIVEEEEQEEQALMAAANTGSVGADQNNFYDSTADDVDGPPPQVGTTTRSAHSTGSPHDNSDSEAESDACAVPAFLQLKPIWLPASFCGLKVSNETGGNWVEEFANWRALARDVAEVQGYFTIALLQMWNMELSQARIQENLQWRSLSQYSSAVYSDDGVESDEYEASEDAHLYRVEKEEGTTAPAHKQKQKLFTDRVSAASSMMLTRFTLFWKYQYLMNVSVSGGCSPGLLESLFCVYLLLQLPLLESGREPAQPLPLMIFGFLALYVVIMMNLSVIIGASIAVQAAQGRYHPLCTRKTNAVPVVRPEDVEELLNNLNKGGRSNKSTVFQRAKEQCKLLFRDTITPAAQMVPGLSNQLRYTRKTYFVHTDAWSSGELSFGSRLHLGYRVMQDMFVQSPLIVTPFMQIPAGMFTMHHFAFSPKSVRMSGNEFVQRQDMARLVPVKKIGNFISSGAGAAGTTRPAVGHGAVEQNQNAPPAPIHIHLNPSMHLRGSWNLRKKDIMASDPEAEQHDFSSAAASTCDGAEAVPFLCNSSSGLEETQSAVSSSNSGGDHSVQQEAVRGVSALVTGKKPIYRKSRALATQTTMASSGSGSGRYSSTSDNSSSSREVSSSSDEFANRQLPPVQEQQQDETVDSVVPLSAEGAAPEEAGSSTSRRPAATFLEGSHFRESLRAFTAHWSSSGTTSAASSVIGMPTPKTSGFSSMLKPVKSESDKEAPKTNSEDDLHGAAVARGPEGVESQTATGDWKKRAGGGRSTTGNNQPVLRFKIHNDSASEIERFQIHSENATDSEQNNSASTPGAASKRGATVWDDEKIDEFLLQVNTAALLVQDAEQEKAVEAEKINSKKNAARSSLGQRQRSTRTPSCSTSGTSCSSSSNHDTLVVPSSSDEAAAARKTTKDDMLLYPEPNSDEILSVVSEARSLEPPAAFSAVKSAIDVDGNNISVERRPKPAAESGPPAAAVDWTTQMKKTKRNTSGGGSRTPRRAAGRIVQKREGSAVVDHEKEHATIIVDEDGAQRALQPVARHVSSHNVAADLGELKNANDDSNANHARSSDPNSRKKSKSRGKGGAPAGSRYNYKRYNGGAGGGTNNSYYNNGGSSGNYYNANSNYYNGVSSKHY